MVCGSNMADPRSSQEVTSGQLQPGKRADKVNFARKISAGDIAEMVRMIVGAHWMVLCAGGCLVSDGKVIFPWSHFLARLAAVLRAHPPIKVQSLITRLKLV